MQILGLAPDRAFIPGPYKTYRPAEYHHSAFIVSDGAGEFETEDRYLLWPEGETGFIDVRITYRRNVMRRVTADAPPVAVYSPKDPKIERFYKEDAVIEVNFMPALNIERIEHYVLKCTVPSLSDLLGSARLVGMMNNPVYALDVYEPRRDG